MIPLNEEYKQVKKLIEKLNKLIIVYSNYSSIEFFKNIGFTEDINGIVNYGLIFFNKYYPLINKNDNKINKRLTQI